MTKTSNVVLCVLLLSKNQLIVASMAKDRDNQKREI